MQDIELRRMAFELNSALARVAFVERQLENSVPVEVYEAKVAESDARERENASLREKHREEIARIKSEYEGMLAEKDDAIRERDSRLRDYHDMEAALRTENMDYRSLYEFWQRRQFGPSSEAMVDEMDRLVGKLPDSKEKFLADTLAMINRVNGAHGLTEIKDSEGKGQQETEEPGQSSAPKGDKTKKTRKPWRKSLKCRDVREIFGLDFSNLPPGSKVALRKVNGTAREEIRELEILYCQPARFYSVVYKIANCNVPGSDGTRQTARPDLLFGNVPVDPSFARFYLEMKFMYNRSEGQIVDYMHRLGCTVVQETLNRWMHVVMKRLMDTLLPEMKKEIRKSRFTHNDETRLLVRSFNEELDRNTYSTEYIHGIYSPSANLFLMLYKNGSRSHDVQMEIFEGSAIEAFTADRCALYLALQKEFEVPPIRGACWIHYRRYLLYAYRQDERLLPVVLLLARLFAAEKIISRDKNLTETERVREREVMCRPIVEAIFKFMQSVRDSGNEYGVLAQRAADYLLDDRDGFTAFLSCGLIEISNNAIERCFRHLALGRRNWLQCGSHESAEHTAFMYSLVESCRMNKIDFGEYIEYVLRQIMDGNKDYSSLIPNHVKLPESGSEIKVA